MQAMEYFDFYGSHQDTALFTVLATKPVGEWKLMVARTGIAQV